MPARRALCERCLRPHSACICHWARPTAHHVEVLVLQHPLEVHEAKGTARLLQLSLASCRVAAGEVFEPAGLLTGSRRNLLLYPGESSPPSRPRADEDLAELRLIVIDATWRKSRKMLHLNPWLRELPRLSLQGLPPSRYTVRKAHAPDQLSTLEATCAALSQLEGDAARFEPLLSAFDGFVAELDARRRINRPDQ